MTTNELFTFRDNKHSCICYHYTKEIVELKNQVNCLQKSLADLRKDLFHSSTEASRNKDRSFWIHGNKFDKSVQSK